MAKFRVTGKNVTGKNVTGKNVTGKDPTFQELLSGFLLQLKKENPRNGVPRSVMRHLPSNIDVDDARCDAREARVAYVLDRVAISGGRGLIEGAKPDGRLSHGESCLITELTPNAQLPRFLDAAPALYPSHEHEGLKYVLMLRDSDFSTPAMRELALFLAPWYGLTSEMTSHLQTAILKEAKNAVSFHDINLRPLAQNVFTLDDILGRGHALAVTRQLMERHGDDRLEDQELLLFVHHMFQNYHLLFHLERFSTLQTPLGHQLELELNPHEQFKEEGTDYQYAVEIVKTLPSILRRELLYHDALLHHLTSLPQERFALLYAEGPSQLVEGTMETLRSAQLRGFHHSPDEGEAVVAKTYHSLKALKRGIMVAKELYPDTDGSRFFQSEAVPILRTYAQYFLGIPYQDTFGRGGARGPDDSTTDALLPRLFERLYRFT